ncbi:MAG: YlmC/YmxH family sporulation protein [Clostridia bacterium]|nr:YlmC/YmxH family sporulation protein [Clostridia bacterium]
MNQCTLGELSKKQVINLCDGKLLGYAEDVVIDLCDGKICAILVPEDCGFSFKKGRELRIAWQQIQKIGEDTILVDVHELPPFNSGKKGRKCPL